MNPQHIRISCKRLLCALLFAVSGNFSASATDLANIPLAESSASTISPNIMFILDDSGSMSWGFLPDKVLDDNAPTKNCYKNSSYNRIYYDPNTTYTPPVDAAGVSYPNASFTAAPYNGLDSSSSTVNLSTSFRAYDDNNCWYYRNCGSDTAQAAYYYKHNSTPTVGTCHANSQYTKVTVSSTSGPGGTDERQNFANWYSYYRTRMQMMKTSVGKAFKDIDNKYRVGFTTHSYDGVDSTNSKFLKIANFNYVGNGTSQKEKWYSKLYSSTPSGGTPLRAALSKVGRIYAGQLLTGSDDPIQYSCQQNFAILSTDGYWNGDAGYKIDGTSAIGDQDGSASKPSYDKFAKTNTLADVAYYYYHTDLRTTALGNCTGAPDSGGVAHDVCENNVPKIGNNDAVDDVATHQHMTTFTLGLGVDGTLAYTDGYKTSTSGDYHDIKQGTKFWPKPLADDPTAIDDLWHAAVNGRGTYFSAKNPDSLATGLSKSLSAIRISLGSGTAAATSNLEPVAGDNYVYVASYRTQIWDGDIGAYTIDLSSGQISQSPQWLAGSLLNNKIGTTGDSDSRNIYTYDSLTSNHLKSFTWADLSTAEKAYFDNSKLSQYTAATFATATGATLVNYLRGHNRNEDQDRSPTYGTYARLYRDRENVLGDIIHAQPLYIQKPQFNYVDTGYSTFKSSNATRTGMLYVAANDGMLHAFDASTGSESWAYIPPMLLPDMYKLADQNYQNNHRYFVDGAPTVGDIYTGSAWKTILVAGLNNGGRGYYALDITDPAAPKALWNFTSSDDSDLGYSYGKPLITKLADGTWVVLVTSGYNNVAPGDGKGYLYVLDASTGALIRKIGTGEGSTTNPSGLAQTNNWVDSLDLDNTTLRVYGGDLYGNLWRFNADSGAVQKIAAFGASQPITVRPELGEINGKAVVFLGTGRYLGQSDLATTGQQTIYAIKDNLGSTSLDDPRTSALMVKQTLTTDGSNRTASTNTVDWDTQMGWYVDLPDSGERVNIDPLLQLGTLTVASNVPSAGACTSGGYSWLYSFDYKTGSYVSTSTNNILAKKLDYITVGLNVVRLPGGTVIIYRTGHKKPTPETREMPMGSGTLEAKRVTWRELVN